MVRLIKVFIKNIKSLTILSKIKKKKKSPFALFIGIYCCVPLGHILVNYFRKLFMEEQKSNSLF